MQRKSNVRLEHKMRKIKGKTLCQRAIEYQWPMDCVVCVEKHPISFHFESKKKDEYRWHRCYDNWYICRGPVDCQILLVRFAECALFWRMWSYEECVSNTNVGNAALRLAYLMQFILIIEFVGGVVRQINTMIWSLSNFHRFDNHVSRLLPAGLLYHIQ